MKTHLKTIFIISLLIAAACAARPAGALENQARLVSPEWLAANLNNPKVRVVDMRDDLRDYWESHIPGAVFLDQAILRWPHKGVPGKLMPADALGRLLGEMGVDGTTTIVIYSEVNHYRAAHFGWALDYIPHKSWAILEGGLEKWKREARPMTRDYPVIRPVAYPAVSSPDADVLATLDEVVNRDPNKTVLLDVRPPDLYSGDKGSWKRKGHIRGALNHFWAWDLKEDGSWKGREILLKNFSEMGATPDKLIIVSCGQGQMAAHAYFTLKYILGFPRVKNYEGSFSEWSNNDGLPVESGKK